MFVSQAWTNYVGKKERQKKGPEEVTSFHPPIQGICVRSLTRKCIVHYKTHRQTHFVESRKWGGIVCLTEQWAQFELGHCGTVPAVVYKRIVIK